jgi:hypothetical protein
VSKLKTYYEDLDYPATRLRLKQALADAILASNKARGRDAGERRFWSSVLLVCMVCSNFALIASNPTLGTIGILLLSDR